MPHHHDDATPPADFWEDRYASSDKVWSGKVNHALVQAVSGLTPGRSLDLGCGEGGDVLWLAEQGWDATGIDISATATQRGAAAATAAGLADRAHFVAADLGTWTGDDAYDLVTASFLQSPVELPRAQILRQAAQLVAPGGHLVVIAHAAMPPWAKAAGHDSHDFLSPADELAALDLDGWTTVTAEVRSREATGPDGQHAMLDDTVVVLRR